MSRSQLEKAVDRLYREADPDIEVKVRMININWGHSKELLSACKPLAEYSWFIAKIREHNRPDENGERIGLEAAIDRAVAEMPDDYLIKGFIIKNQAEVKSMCLTEYNEAEVMELFKEEGWKEGWEDGWEDGRKEGWENGRKEGWEDGRKEGWEDGRKEGQDAGREETLSRDVVSVMNAFGVSMDKAMETLAIPKEQYPKYRNLIGNL